MADLIWIMLAIRAVQATRKAMTPKSPNLTQVVKDKLQSIDAGLDEQVIREFRAGANMLIDSLNTNSQQLKRENLQAARNRFATLEALDPNDTTAGTSARISNIYLICLGLFGSYHYYAYSNDFKMAAVKVYYCGLVDPLICLSLFPAQFFDKKLIATHKKLIKQHAEFSCLAKKLGLSFSTADQLTFDLDAIEKKYQEELQSYESKNAASGVSALAGGAAAVGLSALLTGGLSIIAGGAIWAAIRKATEPTEPTLDEAHQQLRELSKDSKYDKVLEKFTNETHKQCTERLNSFKLISPTELKKLQAKTE